MCKTNKIQAYHVTVMHLECPHEVYSAGQSRDAEIEALSRAPMEHLLGYRRHRKAAQTSS